ncbi:MAG TPA: ABC transporter permease [Methanocella sp.]|nr:ABC transporter permease [Methanocella sp.]
MRPELVIAEKEFMDHLTSKRFLIILGVLLLLAAYAMATGMDQYNKSLENYKDNKANGASNFEAAVNNEQKAIDDAVNSGASPESIESMKADLQALKNNRDYYLNPSMPSLLQIFQSFTFLFAVLGMVLGIAMGFDQMTKEKESGALKSVLSAPVYRDALINGKTLGSLATLAVAIGITFLVTIAVMLFYGVVPGLEDLARVFLFFIGSLLYCTVFFAIAMMTSTLARNSAMAVILAIGIVFTLFIIALLASIITTYVITTYIYANTNNTTVTATQVANDYYQISDVLNIASPFYDYTGYGTMSTGIAGALLSNDKIQDPDAREYLGSEYVPSSQPEQATLEDSLSYIWVKVLMLLVETMAAFGISYAIFMRMDVR